MSTFKPKPGDQVQHRRWPSFGVGRVEEIFASELPSIPAKKCRVRFGHVSRPCFIEDLEPPKTMQFGERKTQLVAVDGDLVA